MTLQNVLMPIKGGVFNYFDFIYREDEADIYIEEMGENYNFNNNGRPRSERSKVNYYNLWRTYQVSDHLPKWLLLRLSN